MSVLYNISNNRDICRVFYDICTVPLKLTLSMTSSRFNYGPVKFDKYELICYCSQCGNNNLYNLVRAGNIRITDFRMIDRQTENWIINLIKDNKLQRQCGVLYPMAAHCSGTAFNIALSSIKEYMDNSPGGDFFIVGLLRMCTFIADAQGNTEVIEVLKDKYKCSDRPTISKCKGSTAARLITNYGVNVNLLDHIHGTENERVSDNEIVIFLQAERYDAIKKIGQYDDSLTRRINRLRSQIPNFAV